MLPVPHRRRDPIGRLIGIFVGPYTKNGPTVSGESPIGITVARDVALDLSAPPSCIVPGVSAMFRTAMPETTIQEDGDLHAGEDDVRCSGRPLDDPTMQTKSQAAAMQC